MRDATADELSQALSDIWDREPDAVWEPWVPEVGQWVQYRKSRECPLAGDDVADGAIGVVYWREDPVSTMNGQDRAHRFWVDWGNDVTAFSAAAELIPVHGRQGSGETAGEAG